MTSVEFAVGYLFAWIVRKGRRVAGRLDGEADRALDAGMERLHAVVSAKIGDDSALGQLDREACAGQEEPGERTRQRVVLALEDAAEGDPAFALALEEAVTAVRDAAPPASAVVATGGAVAAGGDVRIHADNGSFAAGVVHGGVALPPRSPAPDQG